MNISTAKQSILKYLTESSGKNRILKAEGPNVSHNALGASSEVLNIVN